MIVTIMVSVKAMVFVSVTIVSMAPTVRPKVVHLAAPAMAHVWAMTFVSVILVGPVSVARLRSVPTAAPATVNAYDASPPMSYRRPSCVSAIPVIKAPTARNRSVSQSRPMVRCARARVDASSHTTDVTSVVAIHHSRVPSAVIWHVMLLAPTMVYVPARMCLTRSASATKVGSARIVIALVTANRSTATVAASVSLV